jgi:hypothetical protein
MAAHTMVVIIGVTLVAISISVWAWRISKKEEEKASEREWSGSCGYGSTRSYGSTSNNHDHQKRQYRTQDEADMIISRMRSQGKDTMGTLRSYYNPDYGKWFVGNSN